MNKLPNLLSLSAFTVLALLLVWPATGSGESADTSSQDPPPAEEKAQSNQDLETVERIVTALKLVAWGRTNSSPEALLAAAGMLSKGPLTYVEMEKAVSSIADSATTQGTSDKPRPGQISVEALLDEAEKMASEQKLKHLARHIAKDGDRLLPATSRGAVGGPQIHSDRLLSRSSHSYQFTFQGRKKASVAVVGDGETDLDMYIYDEAGKLVGLSDTGWDDELMYWKVNAATKYRVEVRNVGSVYNDYTIITN